MRQSDHASELDALQQGFCTEYRTLFERVAANIEGLPANSTPRLVAHRLLNREMFVRFLARTPPRCRESELLDFGAMLRRDNNAQDMVELPDEVFAAVGDLFDRYQFHVGEATPRTTKVSVGPEVMGTVYEQTVAGRHLSGSYYTPRAIVSFMCREVLKRFLTQACSRHAPSNREAESITRFVDEGDASCISDPVRLLHAVKSLKVCDPACGSGEFLVGVMRELLRLRESLSLAHGLDAVTPYQRTLDILRDNIHGVDISHDAVQVTLQRLWLDLVSQCSKNGSLHLDEGFNIRIGDSLTGADPRTPSDFTAPRNALDWRAEFAGVFKRGGFDVVLMNPPYVPAYSRQAESLPHEEILRDLYGHCGGRLNTFTCFLMRAAHLLNPSGCMSLIVPDTYAIAGSYKLVRESHARRFPSQQWLLIKPPVFGASVRNVVVTLAPGRRHLCSAVIDDVEEVRSLAVSPPVALPTVWGNDHTVHFFLSKTEQEIWAAIRKHPLKLEDYFLVRDGVNPGPRQVRERILAIQANDRPSSLRKLVEGKDVNPRGYEVTWGRRHIRYDADLLSPHDKKAGASLREEWIFESPKLISRQTADTLIVAMDLNSRFVCLNSVHCLHAKSGNVEELWALLGLLNSPLARLFYAIDGGETRDLLPQVHISWLRRFPIPEEWSCVTPRLSELARSLHSAKSWEDAAFVELRHQLHCAVCELYGFTPSGEKQVWHSYLVRYPRFQSDCIL